MNAFGTLMFLLAMITVSTVRGQVPADFAEDIPRGHRYAVLHYAGSIGFVSAGLGTTNSRATRSMELLVGYLPESIGGAQVVTLNGRLGLSTKQYPVRENVSVSFLQVNLGVSYAVNCEHHVTWPEEFPSGYYWWSEAIRVNLNVGSSVVLKKRYTVYYELGTNELKLVSYVQNTTSLSIFDMLHLGLGLRYRM